MSVNANIIILWLIGFGYLLITLMFFSIAFKPDMLSDDALKYRVKWCFLTIIIILIGLNSIFDLHKYLTGLIREYAHEEGWYQHRRQHQMVFLAGIISLGIIISLKSNLMLSVISIENRRLLYGIVFLGIITIFDLISFHPVDALFKKKIFGLNVRFSIELLGIIWMIFSLIIKITQGTKKPFSPKRNSRIRFV